MPVKFKTPKAQGKRAQEKHEKILASLKILAEKQNKVAMQTMVSKYLGRGPGSTT